MHIALTTCTAKPDGCEDDRFLREALLERGHSFEQPIWSEKNEWARFDLCLIRSTWDYYLRLPEFLSWARAVAEETRLLNPLEVLRWNCSKEYLLELLAANLPVIPSAFFTSLEPALEEAERVLNTGPLIIKPAVSAGALHTYRFDRLDRSSLDASLAAALGQSPVLLQPCLDAVKDDGEISLVYLKSGDSFRFSHAAVKKPKTGDFRVQCEHGGSVEAIELAESSELRSISEKALQHIPPGALYARVDLLDWKRSPLIGEIELIEPEFFFRCSPNSGDSARLFVAALESLF